MVKMTIGVKTYPNKHKEFLQTLIGLVGLFRKEKGCIKYDFSYDTQNISHFNIASEWETMGAVEEHFKGKYFGVYLGAIQVLCEEPDVKITYGQITLGMEAIEAARGE
jgi:quinol monooxygenase YgiN